MLRSSSGVRHYCVLISTAKELIIRQMLTEATMKKMLLVMIIAMTLPMASFAKPGFYKKWQAAYPNSKLTGCTICHANQDDYALNPYGQDALNANFDFASIEAMDSDGDHFTNIEEINAGTMPGDAASHP